MKAKWQKGEGILIFTKTQVDCDRGLVSKNVSQSRCQGSILSDDWYGKKLL